MAPAGPGPRLVPGVIKIRPVLDQRNLPGKIRAGSASPPRFSAHERVITWFLRSPNRIALACALGDGGRCVHEFESVSDAGDVSDTR